MKKILRIITCCNTRKRNFNNPISLISSLILFFSSCFILSENTFSKEFNKLDTELLVDNENIPFVVKNKEALNLFGEYTCLGIIGGTDDGDDFDGDGICNEEDLDDDNDGILDIDETTVYCEEEEEVNIINMRTGWNVGGYHSTSTVLVSGCSQTNGNTYGNKNGLRTYNDTNTTVWWYAKYSVTPNYPVTITGVIESNRVDYEHLGSIVGRFKVDGVTQATVNSNVGYSERKLVNYTYTPTTNELIIRIEYDTSNTGKCTPYLNAPEGYAGVTSITQVINSGVTTVCSGPENNDLDNDGILNSFDTDADGDGCPDAIEGDASLEISDLGVVNTDSASSSYGVPLIVGEGQGVGTSQNSLDTTACDQIVDTDSDGIPDSLDLDDDNDGILDVDECLPIPLSALSIVSDGKWSTRYWTGISTEALPHSIVPITEGGILGGLDEYGLPIESANPTSTSLCDAPSNSALSTNCLSNDGSQVLELIVSDMWVQFPSSLYGTTIKIRVDPIINGTPVQSGAWVIATNCDPNNWIDPVHPTYGPLLDMDNTTNFVGQLGGATPPFGYEDWASAGNSVGIGYARGEPWLFEAEIVVSETGHFLREYVVDQWVSYSVSPFEYSTDGGVTWIDIDSTWYNSSATCEILGSDLECDEDGDGIPNRLDLDSDGDGCPDAIEGDGIFTKTLVNSTMDGGNTSNGGAFTGTTNNSVIQNLGNNVNTDSTSAFYGVPIVALAGQGTGAGLDSSNVENCRDGDNDGIVDANDLDDDNDGIPDTIEEATASNGGDTDGDGIPDSSDLDSDNDGILDIVEAGHNQNDIDQDGRLDGSIGTDGIPDVVQNSDGSDEEVGVNYTLVDTDGDNVPDFQDLDSDNDGINDVIESMGTDENNNGLADGSVDENGIPSSAGSKGNPEVDTDGDGVPNQQDLDSDNDGINDVVESGNISVDSNGDGLVDGDDTDEDGIPDTVDGDDDNFGDLNASNPIDSDTDGVPDFLDLDSDNDGINDVEEGSHPDGDTDGDGLINGPDTDGDGIQDPADESSTSFGDLNSGNEPDTDGNGSSDYIEPNGSVSSGPDTDGDGIQDVDDLEPNVFGDAATPLPDLTPSMVFSSTQLSLDKEVDMLLIIRNIGDGSTSDTYSVVVDKFLLSTTGLEHTIANQDSVTIQGQTVNLDNDKFTITSTELTYVLESNPGVVLANASQHFILFKVKRLSNIFGDFTTTATVTAGSGGGETPTDNNVIVLEIKTN
ncbi:hypothetical protein [uncultured Polaribacter sp.]|uniref:hypothetical protein n=1 Tax=uncultured Polaribacter sp. TaxID=174711 RepID=UPI0026205F95|nr:hypothetical protein [uncultured Polaribacter sp.]